MILCTFNSLQSTYRRTLNCVYLNTFFFPFAGLEALGQLKKSWSNLLIMFGEIKTNIQSSMQTALNDLGYGLVNAPLKKKYVKMMTKKIFRDCFSASIHVYLIQKQAELYYKVSNRILMPALNSLNDLIGIDPTDTEKVQNLKHYFEENVKNELPEKIDSMVEQYKKHFETKYEERIQSVSTLLKTVSESLPEEAKKSVEETVKDANDAINQPFGQEYGDQKKVFVFDF
jgi:DNA anti-recombination protein RmuC